MECISFRKSNNKETKTLTSIREWKVSEVCCRTGNNFTHRFLREPRRKLAIQFIKARKESIAMLPLAMRDINENKSRFRTAAVKHPSSFYDWHVKSFIKFLLPFEALCRQGSITVKCQGTKHKVWNMKYYGKLKTSQAAKLTASDVGAGRWTNVCSYG